MTDATLQNDLFATTHPEPVTGHSQCAEILRYLKAGGRITPMVALQKMGCFRLGARISDLRAKGYRITSTLVTVEGGKRVSEYALERGQ